MQLCVVETYVDLQKDAKLTRGAPHFSYGVFLCAGLWRVPRPAVLASSLFESGNLLLDPACGDAGTSRPTEARLRTERLKSHAKSLGLLSPGPLTLSFTLL